MIHHQTKSNLSKIRRGCSVTVLVTFISMIASCSRPGNNEQSENDPESWAEKKGQFQKDFALFASLEEPDASKVELLYKDLLDLESADRERLWHAAEAFSLWLARLDEPDRKSILDQNNSKDRLTLVRKFRESQWLAGLPRADQENIRDLEKDPDARALLISRIRADEIERKSRHYEVARKQVLPGPTKPGAISPSPNKNAITSNNRPAKLEELPPEVQLWINEKLVPRLSVFEQNQLRLATGRWPDYPRVIYQLSRDHFLLPESQQPIQSFGDIPEVIRDQFNPALVAGVIELKGWTPPTAQSQDYALALAKWAVLEKISTGFLGPTNAASLPDSWRAVVEKTLMPRLVREERQFLRRAEGKWPDYPRALVDLLVSRRMTVPGNALPGPPSLWQDALSPK